MRWRVFEIIELAREKDRASMVYDSCMMAVILVSMIPLTMKESLPLFRWIDGIAAVVFIADYLPRLATADLKLGRGPVSFLLYPVTPMAIIDLLSILPFFMVLTPNLRLAKVFRLFRTLRVFRAFKIFRYSKSARLIGGVIRAQRRPLLAVCSMAVGYVLLSALLVFNVEPDTFGTYFDAVYWATVSLTTIGYGDIAPVTPMGRLVTMASAFVGTAIVALPAGIITAGYMERTEPN
ncbi:MAG: ion transporter [Oscillibacter sp.]|nr:ion transporter [Oscillibacter sp.]